MNCFLRPQSLAVILPALAPWLAFSAVPSLVLESDQGALRTGGSGIADNTPKTLSFTSGTSYLQLTSVDLALVAGVAGTFQVDFRLYSTSGSGEPQSLLYTTSFNPSLTTSSTWYSLPISYTLDPSTSYAFGFSAPVSISPSVSFPVPANYIKWVNTQYHQPTTGSITGHEGFSNFDTDGYFYDPSTHVWTGTQANNNAFRLYAAPVPESQAGPMMSLGLIALGVLEFSRRRNDRPRSDS